MQEDGGDLWNHAREPRLVDRERAAGVVLDQAGDDLRMLECPLPVGVNPARHGSGQAREDEDACERRSQPHRGAFKNSEGLSRIAAQPSNLRRPYFRRPSLRTSSALHSGPQALFTPDLERPSLRTSSAFTPDLERPSLRTSSALHSALQAPFTPDLKRPSLRTSSALTPDFKRPSLRTSSALHSALQAPFTPHFKRPSLRTRAPFTPDFERPSLERRSVSCAAAAPPRRRGRAGWPRRIARGSRIVAI